MNSVRRALGVFATSADSAALILRSYSSAAYRRRSKSAVPEIPRPTEIPFQPKVANSVNLIGQVRMPIQFQTATDGNTWAATVITRQESPASPYLWIPVIFEGDLAHTAFSHLKENDFIHIAGQLSTDPPHLHEIEDQPQTNIQVMVQSLNFVQGYPQEKNISATLNQEKVLGFSDILLEEKVGKCSYKEDKISSQTEQKKYIRYQANIPSKQCEEHDIDKSWKELLSNPVEWWDVRSTKENPEGAAFERKTNGELLFINSSTPKWLQEKLESMTIDLKPELKYSISAKKDLDSSLSSWRDLLDDPKQWCDFRDSKLNGLVKPRYPDFKRKDGSVPLWLNTAPKWVLSKLKGLEFDVPVVKSKPAKDSKGNQSWNDLLKNPDKWWDNRSNKRNERAPDFKHKETGEVLWLNGSPSWVLSKLPPLMPKQNVEIGRKQTLVS